MTRIEKSFLAMATLLGIMSLSLISNQNAFAAGVVYYCDTSNSGIVTCNCFDNLDGTVCVGSNVTLYWCTTTATPTCVARSQQQCPLQGTGFVGRGDCTSYQQTSMPCNGGTRNSCL